MSGSIEIITADNPLKENKETVIQFPRFYRHVLCHNMIILFTDTVEGMVISHPAYPFGTYLNTFKPCSNQAVWKPCEPGFEVTLKQKY